MNSLPQKNVLSEIETSFTYTNKLLDKSCEFLSTVDKSVNNYYKVIKDLKEIDSNLHQINAKLELSLKEYDLRIEKVRHSASILKIQFEYSSSKIDLILDSILKLSDSNDETSIKNRTQLFEIVKSMSETNANIFLSFLLI
jgi:hypothetical protein